MNVLEKIASGKSMPILFIGSGISRRYLYKYPNWEELLKMSFKKVYSDSYQYQKHYDALNRKGLSDFDINATLGSIIEDSFNEAFFDRKIKIKGTSNSPSWVKAGVSPYKMYLSQYFKKIPVNTNSYLQEEIQKFKNLKNKVSAVITTNYDMFLETEIFNSDYQVFIHQHELFSCDSYNTAEIYKIHGCASDANSIIINKNDYDNFNASRKLIIAKMLTLFAESPIIFMGYSFTDEDVQNIISDFLGCLSEKDLEHINEHFVFISRKKGVNDLREINRSIITSRGIEIPITDIETDNFALVFDILNQITPGISPSRIRDTKRLVKTIVDQSISSKNAESLIVGIEDLDNVDLSSKPLAIAIGYRENILNKVGYGLLDPYLILEDIIYNNKNFDAEQMCTTRFKSLPYTQLIPVYKYVKQYNGTIASDSKLQIYINHHDSLDKIISKKVQKTLDKVSVFNNYDDLKLAIDAADTAHKKAGVLLKNINIVNTDELRHLCIYIHEEDPSVAKHSTHFKRCVMCLDFFENK